MQKKIAIGCGVAVVLFVIVRVGPRVFQWAQHQIAEEQERQRLAADWQPPAKDAGLDTLFPPKVHDFQRVSHDDKAAILDHFWWMKGWLFGFRTRVVSDSGCTT